LRSVGRASDDAPDELGELVDAGGERAELVEDRPAAAARGERLGDPPLGELARLRDGVGKGVLFAEPEASLPELDRL
jgi:hypothetical protein